MTTVSSPLNLNSAGPTVLLGYEPNLKMFAGFDISAHKTFTSGSPSVQIDRRVIEKALSEGLAFDRKSNDEVAVGFRPDQIISYIANADDLHKYGSQAKTFRLLTKASSLEEVSNEELKSLPETRRRIVRKVSRLSRQGNFRSQVLSAYDNRCAVTKIQLRLIDAAHILPVGAPGSADNVCNGIALQPTYHRAYDNGLIYLDETFQMRVNPAKELALASLNLDGGLAGFKSTLGKIYLPPDRRQWPSKSFIKKANRFRQVG